MPAYFSFSKLLLKFSHQIFKSWNIIKYLKRKKKRAISLTFTFWLTEYYISERILEGDSGVFFVLKNFIILYNVFEFYNKIIISKVLIVQPLYKPLG